MAKDRGNSTHFFAALLVACGLLSFGLLEWRLSKTLSHHPTRHEGDGPWLKPRVYHRRRPGDGVGSGASSAAAAEAAAARAARAADRAYAASLTAKDAAGQTRAQIAEEDAAFAAHLAVVPPPHRRAVVPHTPKARNPLRYWTSTQSARDAELLRTGKVPPVKSEPETFLTFVPDVGGFNNVRLALENVLVVARATSRTLVLPPPQTWYKLGDKIHALEEFLPDLLNSERVSVITAQQFVEEKLPKTHALQPPSNVADVAKGCHPTHKARDSCFVWYAWLEEHFGRDEVIPDVGLTCLVFGSLKTNKCGPKTSSLTTKQQAHNRTLLDGYGLYGAAEGPILHMRSSGQATHFHEQIEANRKGRAKDKSIKPMEPARLGRLLAPFYAYVIFPDPSVSNFYKRLIRDVVHFDDRIYKCASLIVRWLGAYSSLHARRGDFQYSSNDNAEVVLRSVKRGEVLWIASDAPFQSFSAFERAGRPVMSLAYLLDLQRRQKRHIIIEKRLDGLSMPPHEVWAALDTIKAHEYGFVDVLVAAEGRTFTGTWFSTFSGLIQRIRGYRGKNDRDTFFSSRERWAAFQGFESPRAPLYQREWPAAWRNIEGDTEAAPLVGERSYDRDDVWQLQKRYPATGTWHPSTACDLPSKMRYWSAPEGSDLDMRLLKEGRVPPLNRDRFLTFVPDLGGFNNVRLALENVVVLARATGRTLVLPPPQTYYLFTACKEKCAFGLEELLPGLLARKDRVITAREFLSEEVPRLKVDPPQHLSDVVDRCTPTKKAGDSCFVWYDWLESNFGDPDHFPDVGLQCVVFGNKTDDGIADFCAPRTQINGVVARKVVDGDAYYGQQTPILHLRTCGVATHFHDQWHGKPKGDRQVEPARMGRLLAPFYTYVYFADPAVGNFYKRLVRDVVRVDEPRVTCVSGKIVEWLGTKYVSVHARRNEFQFVEAKTGVSDAVLRTMPDSTSTVYVATDEKDATFFDELRAHHQVVLLDELREAASNVSRGIPLRPGRWPSKDVLMALNRINGNELGFVDALIASQGTIFTGAWFSTYTGLVNRWRGYGGFSDSSSYFSTPGRFNAFQGYEKPRSPLYMREWVEGWRGIDSDLAAGPRPGERVFVDGAYD